MKQRAALLRFIPFMHDHGFVIVDIFDGEAIIKPRSDEEAVNIVFSVDECEIRMNDPKRIDGFHKVWIVLEAGGDHADMLCDWTVAHEDPDKFNYWMCRFIDDLDGPRR